MWRAIFIRFSHPCEVTDVMTNVILGVCVEMLTNIMMGIREVRSVVVINVVTSIDVDMLADENVNGLAAVVTPLEFTLPAP